MVENCTILVFILFSKSQNMKTVILLAVLIISPVLASSAFAHQVDAVDDYRIQIDWKNWPVVAGEANAIIVYVSEMDKSLEPVDQEFVSEKGLSLIHI